MSLFKRLTAVSACVMVMLMSATLVRGDATPATGKITGTVSTATGPAASVSVKVWLVPAPAADKPAPAATEGKHHHAAKPKGPPTAETTTGQDGTYSFANLAPGEYTLYAGDKTVGMGHATATVTAGGTATADITLKQHVKKPAN